jgi:hypothetical protein
MTKLLSVIFFIFLTSACGESPLLNHKFESGNFINDPLRAESEALSFNNSGYSFNISWIEGPRLGASRFLVKTWKSNSGTMNGPYSDLPKPLVVFLWMPAMGHGSAPVKLRKLTDGEYEVSEVQFIMGGKWEIKFQLKEGNQVFDETMVTLSL